MRNMIFFVSYYEAIKELPEEQQGIVYKAIIGYAMEGIEPILNGLAKSVFILIKPYIDSSRKKQESGASGGNTRKKSSKNISKNISEDNSKQLSKEESKMPSKQLSNQIIKNEDEYEYKEESFKKEINKEKSTILTDSELNILIDNEFSDEDVCKKFKEYSEMRKAMGKNKAIRTTGTFESCIQKLRKYAKNKQEAMEILDNSISNCYQGLFDIYKHTISKTPQQESIPYAN